VKLRPHTVQITCQCITMHGKAMVMVAHCRQQRERMCSSFDYCGGERIAPPSIIWSAWCVYCGEHIAPPAAMASGMVSTTAFVVNLPLLRPGTRLHEALVADGFPVDTSLDVSTLV